MTIIGAVSIGMVQADVNTKIDSVVLRVPPTGVDDLVRIGCGVHRTIGDTVVHAVVTIVIDPVAETVGPVSARACVADSGLWRWRAGRWGRWAILARSIAGIGKDDIVVGVVGGGMVENRFLRGGAGIGRIQERRDRFLQRERAFHRCAAHAEEDTTEQESCQCVLDRMSHCIW